MPPGQDRDVLQHGLAAIAKARRLHGRDLEAAAQLVDDQRRQSLALDIFGDDDQRLAGLHHRLEDGKHRLQRRQLLLVDENVGILELGDHLLGIGDEVGREIAAVELHALDDVELGLGGLGFFDRDHALVADLLHGFGDHLADRGVAIRRDGADLSDLLGGLHLLRTALHILHHRGHGYVDAALEVHRVHAGGNELDAFLHDRSGKDRRGRGAIPGEVARLRGDFAHHLSAHVLELVVQFDLLGDGDAIFGDARRAEALVEDDIASLGTERHLNGAVENIDPSQ